MRCPRCGSVQNTTALYCGTCGTGLKANTQTTHPPTGSRTQPAGTSPTLGQYLPTIIASQNQKRLIYPVLISIIVVLIIIVIFGGIQLFSLSQQIAALQKKEPVKSGIIPNNGVTQTVNVPTATQIPTSAPTPNPTPTTRPIQPGDILYQGLCQNWPIDTNWTCKNNNLIGNYYPASGLSAKIFAPIALNTSDYSVETTVQLLGNCISGGPQLFARYISDLKSITAGYEYHGNYFYLGGTNGNSYQTDISSGIYTLRLEVKDVDVRFYLNGGLIMSGKTSIVEPGTVGLGFVTIGVKFSTFKLTAL